MQNTIKQQSFLQKIRFIFFKNLKWKHVLPIIILGLVDMLMLLGPLYLRNVFPNPQRFLGITKAQFDNMTAIWGYSAVICYLPSGWLADKFSNKKLVVISSCLTAILLGWWTSIPKTTVGAPTAALTQLGMIYALWGITTTLTFWAPVWRLLSQQVSKEDQGTAYGLQGSFNGIFGVLFVTVIGYFLLKFNSNFTESKGFYIFGSMAAFFLLLGAVGVWFFAHESPIKTDKEARFSWKKLGKILKSGKIWLAALLVNGIYFMQHELAYLVPYMSNIIGISAIFTVLVAGGRTYAARVVISQPVGRVGDKAKSFILILVVGLSISLALIMLILFLPGVGGNFLAKNGGGHWINDPTNGKVWIQDPTGLTKWAVFVQVIVAITILMLGIITWVLVTLRFAMVAELPTPKNSYGTVIGFISLIAFSSNGWFNSLAGWIEKNHSMKIQVHGSSTVTTVANQTGSEIIIGILICIAAVGLIAGWVLYFWTKKTNKNKKQFKREVNN